MSDLIAKNIKKYRKLKGLTQRQLADRCGLSLMSIRRYETIGENNREPRIETSQTIAAALTVPFSYIDPRLPEERDLILEEIYSGKTEPKKNDPVHPTKILELYNQLNDAGKNKVIDYTADLAGNPEYRKDSNE